MQDRFDVIVVGAGPAGATAAYTLAKAGLQVVMFERGEYAGTKNMMGGVMYRHATEQVIPEFWKEAPLERPVVEQNMWVLTKDSGLKMGFRSEKFAAEPYNAYTVLRAKFDRWFAKKAEEAGALLITETVVDEVIKENGKVVGVRTGRPDGELYADVVIAADGVNSLVAKSAGLHAEIPETNVALAVKELIFLPPEKIEERFGLEKGQGATIELAGWSTQGLDGIGLIYTNKECLSVGVGATVSDFRRTRIKPHDMLDAMKAHPLVKPLLEGGETKEYLAHLLPEGGYKAVPKLYDSGVLVVGDAAGLFNKLHREGSNLAVASGQLAAMTVIHAKRVGDYSARTLSMYKDLMGKSYVLNDLKKYSLLPSFMANNHHLYTVYPEMLCEAAEELLTVDGMTKRKKMGTIVKGIRRKRGLLKLAKDAIQGWRAV